VLARGGGTSQCGQTVNHSLVLDCSKYLDRLLELGRRGTALRGRARASCSTISTAR
jgi:FAD/FMN-containing dehydrogenase